jgi:RNA polymerase sigma-70 factor (ECF subfamily)
MSAPDRQQHAPGASTDTRRHESFVRLFADNHRRIYGFIASLVMNRTFAEEVFSETSVVLWREFERFEPGTDFAAWACAVALNQVRRFRRENQSGRLIFSDGLLEKVARDWRSVEREQDVRLSALTGCIGKLGETDRKLIEKCYGGAKSFRDIAAAMGRPADSVYQSLSRIRKSLFRCIERTLKAGSA